MYTIYTVTSIVPSELEGGTLYIPLSSSRQVSFSVAYTEPNTHYQIALIYNEARVNIGNSNLEVNGYVYIILRSCNDSSSPTVRCDLLQLTVYGRYFLDRGRFSFAVVVSTMTHYTSGAITIRIVGKLLIIIRSL